MSAAAPQLQHSTSTPPHSPPRPLRSSCRVVRCQIASNKLETLDSLRHLADCVALSTVDLSSNALDGEDPDAFLELFRSMPSLQARARTGVTLAQNACALSPFHPFRIELRLDGLGSGADTMLSPSRAPPG